jgi:hypothetical protein
MEAMKNERLDVSLLPGDIPTLVLRGAIELDAAGPFEKVVDELLVLDADRIVIDYSSVSFVNRSDDDGDEGSDHEVIPSDRADA